MENEYVVFSRARANGDLLTSPAYILSETCSEKFLGRCDKCPIPEIKFCKQQKECETPHEIVNIKRISDVK